MKYSEQWLREWVDPNISREKLCQQLTLSGFEVEGVLPAKELGSSEKGFSIDISVTPNRGDCLSVRGMAREISAITKSRLKPLKLEKTKPTLKDTLPIFVKAAADCPRYVGRIIRGVSAPLESPTWLKNRLLCSGFNPISPIVDVTNYVMLELGQPMHAFDLNKIEYEIQVRRSRSGEKISLLDGTEKILDAETLIIADKKNPLAIAGVMGGISSCVTSETTDILLESAYFLPSTIARQRQYYGLNSDSSHRFERGVDPTMQREALERATQLILEIAGGNAGPVMEKSSKTHLPKPLRVSVAADKIEKLLGITIPEKVVDKLFTALNFDWRRDKSKWTVVVPAYRFDVTLSEDLIEEIARLYGYDNIPTREVSAALCPSRTEQTAPNPHSLRQIMSDSGYNEIISYSFVDEKLQALLDPEVTPLHLSNPITAEMTVMRTNLWPGLVNAMLYNKSRQQPRARLFEIGTCFIKAKKKLEQSARIAGIITGNVSPEQWGLASKEADFFDLKGDVEALLEASGILKQCTFEPVLHSALHPGQTAAICHSGKPLGTIGALHPTVLQALDISDKVFVFELSLDRLLQPLCQPFTEISKFPEVRRDIAILVKQAIPSMDIQDTIKRVAGDWLKDVFIFDVYQGKGVPSGCKSLAVALILQHPTRTLVDEDAIELTDKVVNALKGQFGAELRS